MTLITVSHVVRKGVLYLTNCDWYSDNMATFTNKRFYRKNVRVIREREN